MFFKLSKIKEEVQRKSIYKIYRTDTGHDFSLYFAYELFNVLEIYLFVFPRSFENPLSNYIYEYSYYAVTM